LQLKELVQNIVILLGRHDCKYLRSYQRGQSFSTVKIPLIAPSNTRIYYGHRNYLILGCSNWSSFIRNLQWYYFVAATTSSSFTINNLIADTDYNFTVLALDADDNASPASTNVP
jgi:hypothetical protein